MRFHITVIRAVLFDVGGVITESPLEACGRFDQNDGLPAGIITGILRQDPHCNAWAQYERGQIDRDAFIALFEAEAQPSGRRLYVRRLFQTIHVSPHEEMVAAIRCICERGCKWVC